MPADLLPDAAAIPLPAAVLLDLDDTIIAFDAVADACWRSLCDRYAAEATVSAEQLLAAIQKSRTWFWSDVERHKAGRRDLKGARRQVVELAFRELRLDCQPLALKLADDYSRERDLLVQPFPGAIETLQALRSRGVALALITNGESSYQRAKVERFGLASYFHCIVIEGEFGIGKPDSAVFRHALGELGCQPADAWMIGDSLIYDIGPALTLGLEAVWIDASRSGLPPEAACQPSRSIGSLAELLLG